MDAVLLLVLLELYHINSCCSHILLCANLKNGLWLKFVFFKIMATFCLFFCLFLSHLSIRVSRCFLMSLACVGICFSPDSWAFNKLFLDLKNLCYLRSNGGAVFCYLILLVL